MEPTMSKLKTCKHCAHFKPNDQQDLRTTAADIAIVRGVCLRYPPMPILMEQKQIAIAGPSIGAVGVNPPVHAGHTCGEWLRHSSLGKHSLDTIRSTESPRTGAPNDHN